MGVPARAEVLAGGLNEMQGAYLSTPLDFERNRGKSTFPSHDYSTLRRP